MPPSIRFRHDVNGLRAIAVLLVVFYHFSIPGFSGGYIGVDIFFVISGYLMAQIICSRCDQGAFYFCEFYISRLKRIFPALLFLIIVFLSVAAFLLLPSEYEQLGLHAFSSLLMFSNILYWRDAGYFDSDALDKWLLHTWSLSVEWQFYLIIPAVLVFAIRWRSGYFLKPILWLGFFSSLFLCVWGSSRYGVASFYLLPTRAWEFLVGVFLFVHSRSLVWLVRPVAFYLGFFLILCCSFIYNKNFNYPSFWAIVPVVGAALIIGSSSTSLILNNKLFQFLGKISYSLYLWHWPILVVAINLGVGHFPALLLVLSLVMSILSFYMIEQPVRRLKTIELSSISLRVSCFFGVVVLGVLVAFSSAFIFLSGGVPARVPNEISIIADEAKNINPLREKCFRPGTYLQYPECRLGVQDGVADVVLWGDSHSDASFTGFSEAAKQVGRSGVYYGRSGCAPTLTQELLPGGDEADLFECLQYNEEVYRRISRDFSVRDVYLIARWSAEKYSRGNADFSGLMCSLVASGKHVYVVAPIPVYEEDIPLYFSRGLMRGDALTHLEENVKQSYSDYFKNNIFAFEQFSKASRCGVEVLDSLLYLCPQGFCSPTHAGLPIYFDNGHLSERGSRLLVPMFSNALKAAQ
ncbi:acyltransferase family protein [Ectopseudomonas mendocina]|uniref:acyltransferase family protein n=1 Tax=Ectopseudomonas mendocina TaxID=300 RepID=UPI00376F23F3